MCGIAGIHFKKLRSITHEGIEKLVDSLLLGIESRGRDSTGFVAVTNKGKRVVMHKEPVRAAIFTDMRSEIPVSPRTILLHTRWATQGWPTNPDNNHPVQYGDTFVVHNGHINNDDALFAENEFERIGQVDTEIIAAMVNKFGFERINLALKELDGGFAIATINPKQYPNNLILAKGPHNPMYIYETDDYVVWCSERTPIENALEKATGSKPAWADIKGVDSGVIAWVQGNKTEILGFPTYDEIHRPKPTRTVHHPSTCHVPISPSSGATSDGGKEQSEDSGKFNCKGCGHRLMMHPNRTGTVDSIACVGSDKCNCRKYISPNRGNRDKVSKTAIEAYVGVMIDGVNKRCGINSDGDLVDLGTWEIIPWPEEKDDDLVETTCICTHNQFAHVGLVGSCGYKGGCQCTAYLELRTYNGHVTEEEDLEDATTPCDGCGQWSTDKQLRTWHGAFLCAECAGDAETQDKEEDEALNDAENEGMPPATTEAEAREKLRADAEGQWRSLAENEERLHKYCLMETSGKTGYPQHLVDWLLFRCPPELMDDDIWLTNAREQCDESYGEAENAFFLAGRIAAAS